jgi:hypothetical protein
MDSEGEAKILLTLKEMSTSRPKFYHDHEFQNAVFSILELQEEFGSASDHIRASQTFVEVELRKRMRRTQVTRGQFFEKIYEIFPQSIGSSNNETGTDLVEVAYQARFPRDLTNHRLRSSFCKTSNRRMGTCALFLRRLWTILASIPGGSARARMM